MAFDRMKGRALLAMRAVFGLILLALTVLSATWATAENKITDAPFAVDVTIRKIDAFHIGNPEERHFGDLEFIGGLEMVSSDRNFGALSGLALVPEKNLLFAVSDTGFWLTATPITDDDGRISNLSNVKMASIRDEDGTPVVGKWNSDAESLKVIGNRAWVSFERNNRVNTYTSVSDDLATGIVEASAVRITPETLKEELRGNKGLEAVAVEVNDQKIVNRVITIAERSLNKKGNFRGFIIKNNQQLEEFAITRSDEFDATDAAFLENGDLILLERRFNMSSGVAMRLRRLPGNEIRANATLDGKILFQADMAYQIDNMEGLDIHRNSRGEDILTLISDDNHSLLQRNMLLQFRLKADSTGVAGQKP